MPSFKPFPQEAFLYRGASNDRRTDPVRLAVRGGAMTQIQNYADFLNGKTATFEGGVAWKMDFKETVAEFFSLGLLNGMFYQSQEEVLRDAAEIFTKALAECPEFATKAAVYGRTKNALKLAPLIWGAYLSTLEDKTLFNRAFPHLTNNVNLLRDFMEICRKTPIRKGLGRSVKRAVNKRLFELASDYSVSRNKNAVAEIAKVTRPAFNDERFQNYMRYTAKDELSFERAVALKRVLEKIAGNEVDDDVLASIEKYRFQLEELKHAVNSFTQAHGEKLAALIKKEAGEKDAEKRAALKTEIDKLLEKRANALSGDAKRTLYAALYKGLRYAALILNLVALERVFAAQTRTVQKHSNKGRFTQQEMIKSEIPAALEALVCDKIRNVSDYRASNMLPFALISAQRMVTNTWFKEALAEVLTACAGDTFTIPADTEILVGVDISGSMDVMVNDSLSARDVSTLFGALLKMSHENTRVCGLSDDCYPLDFKTADLFGMAREIGDSGTHGGTRLGFLMKAYRGQKFVIILTDSETADDFEAVWKKTARKKGARLIVWQLQAYHIKLSKDPSVVYIAGFSDRLLALVKSIIEDQGSMIEDIENVAL
jgi:60 kDa SS-A/Ro ribonucleoprotein